MNIKVSSCDRKGPPEGTQGFRNLVLLFFFFRATLFNVNGIAVQGGSQSVAEAWFWPARRRCKRFFLSSGDEALLFLDAGGRRLLFHNLIDFVAETLAAKIS